MFNKYFHSILPFHIIVKLLCCFFVQAGPPLPLGLDMSYSTSLLMQYFSSASQSGRTLLVVDDNLSKPTSGLVTQIYFCKKCYISCFLQKMWAISSIKWESCSIFGSIIMHVFSSDHKIQTNGEPSLLMQSKMAATNSDEMAFLC